jgi:hypothetical protein
MPAILEDPPVKTLPLKPSSDEPAEWVVFVYSPASLFSLKASWATSTAGKTLLTPTPYAVKMAFVDAALRCKLIADPDSFVRVLAKAGLRIGLPRHACVTETIQGIRQETHESDRKRDPELPPYRPNVAFREMVHYQGELRFAFDRSTCRADLVQTLVRVAPAINYVGKRGSFIQYVEHVKQSGLDASFTSPLKEDADPAWGHRASLDDFGPKASFDALNSFSTTPIKRGADRIFTDTLVPLGIRNVGPGFTHYSITRSATL